MAINTNLNLMCKYCWSFLYNKIDIAQGHILNFRFRRKKSYQRRGHFLAKISDYISTTDKFHLLKDHLHRSFKTLGCLGQIRTNIVIQIIVLSLLPYSPCPIWAVHTNRDITSTCTYYYDRYTYVHIDPTLDGYTQN